MSTTVTGHESWTAIVTVIVPEGGFATSEFVEQFLQERLQTGIVLAVAATVVVDP